jgi:putative phosphoribosyl transferase
MTELLDGLLDAPLYRDRTEAGRELADLLPGDLGPQTLVVGLARGGVVVAAEIAAARGWPLDVVVVRKVRHPYQPEFALGAVTPGGDVYLRSSEGVAPTRVTQATAQARREAEELDRLVHGSHEQLERTDRPVVLVDDGLATGATLIAAARWARSGHAAMTLAAVPVAARQSVQGILEEIDLLFCPHVRDDLYAVGIWYADFSPVSDDEVVRILDTAAAGSPPGV